MQMKIPDTIDALLGELDKHTQLNSNHFFKCRTCKKRNYHDAMRGFQFALPNQKPTLENTFYFCASCLTAEQYNFILQNQIDIRPLTPNQIQNIEAAYYSGQYAKWISESKE